MRSKQLSKPMPRRLRSGICVGRSRDPCALLEEISTTPPKRHQVPAASAAQLSAIPAAINAFVDHARDQRNPKMIAMLNSKIGVGSCIKWGATWIPAANPTAATHSQKSFRPKNKIIAPIRILRIGIGRFMSGRGDCPQSPAPAVRDRRYRRNFLRFFARNRQLRRLGFRST